MQPSMAREHEVSQLETLIARLKAGSESELLIEHLQTAAAYLQGAMPDECAHNLQMAREASGALSSKPLEAEVRNTVDGLLPELHPPAHAHWRHHGNLEPYTARPTANGLAAFFHGTDLTLGMFYPKKHVVAVFPSYLAAQTAHDVLGAEGFREWEAIAVPGYEVDEFLHRIRGGQSFGARLLTSVSRILDTEAGLTDRYVKWARHGAGFVVAYSPTQEQAEGIQALLRPLSPVDLHWFMAGSIRDLL